MILGICDGHDAGAALVDDGALVFAVSEERLTRRKHQCGFPREAVRAALLFAGGARAIEAVGVAEIGGRLATRALDDRYRGGRDRGALSLRARGMAALSRGMSGGRVEPAIAAAVLDLRLRDFGLRGGVTLLDHHRCHARTAAMGIDEGLVVTLDAYGDGLSGSVSRWQGARLTTLDRLPAPASPAMLYAQVTQLLGFGEGEEGKVVARAAHGDAEVGIAELRRRLRWDGRRFVARGSLPALRRWAKELGPMDASAALQAFTEEIVGRFVADARRRHGGGELGLAGGLFANVAVNRELVRGWDRVFVFPAMGDAGLCAGAAWELAERRGQRLCAFDEARLGPLPGALPTGASVVEGLASAAEELLEGRVVARCAGRLEFGPRALGARSLLLRADRPALARDLNERLGRDPLMPFGPVMTDEAAIDLLPDWPGAVRSMTRHMTVALPASPALRQLAPAAVHRDGTARAQVVTPEQDPQLHALLRGMPGEVLINTSLNRHGEPIAATAADALAVARAAGARLWAA